MLGLILTVIVTLVIVGLLLWALDQLPWVSGDVKKTIHVIVIVVAILWLIGVFFPGIVPLRVR